MRDWSSDVWLFRSVDHTQSLQAFGADCLLEPGLVARHDQSGFAEAQYFGHRVVTAHGNDPLGPLHQAHGFLQKLQYPQPWIFSGLGAQLPFFLLR